MAMQRMTVEVVLALAVAGIVVGALAALVAVQTVPNSGNINVVASVGIGVYSNSNCTTVLSSINWGNLTPGGSETQTIYVENQGNVNVTLAMACGGWNPSTVSSYLTLSWNIASNYVLAPSLSVPALVTLNVSSSASSSTSFSFNMNITATQD